ncbi:MAG: hypothetical protein R3Y24_07235 [Eubacteriales bacterium]
MVKKQECDTYELYNLEKDRTETVNLILQMPEKAKELKALYDLWAKRIKV